MGRKGKLLEGRIMFKAPAKGYTFMIVSIITSGDTGELIKIPKA